MSKRTIIFRADGDSNIGMGHFIRTLALAEMLNKSFTCIFAIRKPNEYQKLEIGKVCQGIIELQEGDSHFQIFVNQLTGKEIVVLDNYFFSTDYQREIKSKGCKLACIDDLHDKHFVADIIINHADAVQAKDYSKEDYTKVLTGFQYALLRKDFLMDNPKNYEKQFSCLIMMGGADPLNLTKKILDLIIETKPSKKIAIVTHKNPEDITSQQELSSITFFKSLLADELIGLMQDSEFAVLPASTVSIEACAARLPFICGYFIDNQEINYQSIASKNMAICIGDYRKLNPSTFFKAVDQMKTTAVKESIIKNQETYIDKLSPKRLLENFLAL